MSRRDRCASIIVSQTGSREQRHGRPTKYAHNSPVTLPRDASGRPAGRRLAWLPPKLSTSAPLDSAVGASAALRRDAIFRRLLVAADAAAAFFALALVVAVDESRGLTWASLGALPLVVLIAKLLGLYDRDELVFHKSTPDEAPALFQLASLFALLSWLLHDVVIDGPLGRLQTLGLWMAFFVLALVGRTVARSVARFASPVERCLVVGTSGARARFAGKLAHAHRGTEVTATCRSPMSAARTPDAGGDGATFERRRANLKLSDADDSEALGRRQRRLLRC